MKYIVALLSIFLYLTSFGFLFQKEKKTFTLANCEKPPQYKFTCCVYDQMEDGVKVNEWVSQAVLNKKMQTSTRGRSNPCDSLGVGIYKNVTYSYGQSKKCDASSPIYLSKGETIPKMKLPALCKLKTKSDVVEYH